MTRRSAIARSTARRPASPARAGRSAPRRTPPTAPVVFRLQRSGGNRAVAGLFRDRAAGTARVAPPGDAREREAQHVADDALRGAPWLAGRTGGASRDGALGPVERRFFEARLGDDFGDVRVHRDAGAGARADALAARAFTVGSDIYFGRGEYAPGTRQGRHLIAHELAHVVQQRGAPAEIQRQPLFGQEIPIELRSSADIAHMSDQELAERHDQITAVIGAFTTSTPETALLEQEAARIGVELGRRRALAAGRTFDEESIKRMKAYFTANARKPPKPRTKPLPPPPPGGWQDSCIIALNHAMKLVTKKPALPTTPETIEQTMAKIAASGHSGVAREVWFESARGRITTGGARPERLHESVWDTVMALAGGDPGWSVFTMSLDDGNHSVTLTLDANDPSRPHLYWSDQWASKGGWKEYSRTGLDAEVTKLVQGWWETQAEGAKFTTVVRLWRVRAGPATPSAP